MKKITKKGVMAMLLSTVMVLSISAQNPNGRGFGPGQGQGQAYANGNCQLQNLIPDLTDDQLAQLQTLRTEHLKEMLNYRNQMGELRAQRRTIMSGYPIDTKAADKLTDKKTALTNKMLKAQTAHQAAVKNILTEEQALAYDQLRQGRNQGQGRGQFAQGKGRGQGQFAQGRAHGRMQGRGQGRMQGQGRNYRW